MVQGVGFGGRINDGEFPMPYFQKVFFDMAVDAGGLRFGVVGSGSGV